MESSVSDGDDVVSTFLPVADDYDSNDELIRLEEEIALLQQLVDLVNARRNAVDDKVFQAQTEVKRLTGHVAALEKRSIKLSEKRAKQLDLHEQMDASIKLSEARLARLSASDVTVEEIERLAADQDVQESFVNELEVPADDAVQLTRAAIVESKGDKDAHDAAQEFGNETGTSSIILAASRVAKTHQLKEYQILRFSCFETFWKPRPRENNLARFFLLPSIASKDQLRAILDISAREILILDILAHEHKGRHRREIMWCTCIDVRMLCSLMSIKVARDDMSTTTIHQNETLKSHSLPAKPTDLVDFTASKTDALNSTTFTDESQVKSFRIDPNVALCPYALAGVCADPDCVYQHIEERVTGSVLPRELVPLPHLGKSTATVTQLRNAPVTVGLHANLVTTADAPYNGDDECTNNSDFILLPMPASNENPFFAVSSEAHGGFWWMLSKDAECLHALPKNAPVSEILACMGVHFAHVTDQQYASMFFDAMPPISFSGSCRATGMMIDCVRVSVHSGRFDVARLLPSLLLEREKWLLNRPSPNECAYLLHEIISICVVLVDRTIQRCYAFNSQDANPVTVTADGQLLLAFLHLFVRNLTLFFDQGNTSTSSRAVQKWLDLLKAIEKGTLFVPVDHPTDSRFGNILQSLCVSADFGEPERELSDPHFALVSEFVDDIRMLMHLKDVVSETKSFRELMDSVLFSALYTFRNLSISMEDQTEGWVDLFVTKRAAIITYIVLGAVEWTTSRLHGDTAIDDFNADLCEVCYVVDKILTELRKSFSSLMTIDLLLSPAYASNVALAITSKVYDRAHRGLESVLVDNDDGNLSLLKYSELLWSQLIQLRASLPARTLDLADGDSLVISLDLPTAIVDSHNFLSDFVSKLEVVPHHVSLANDWNLVAATVRTDESADKQLSVDCLRQLYMQLMTPLSCRSFQKLNGFKNQPLQLCQPYGNPLEIRPTIPHSILLIGSTTLELNLSMTTLRRLPHHFGLYFPCLAVLRLYDNHLEELPETMHHLKHLEELDVGKNYLAQLPTQFALPKLTQLKARENRLTQLPATVKDCKNLELLDLSGNPVGKEIWSLVAALPRLREVLPKSA